MNYKRIYDELIDRALNRPEPDVYTEKHHVIPRSHGGADTADNLVVLTAREHFIAHWLLYRIYRDSSMAFAFVNMGAGNDKQRGRYLNSYGYAEARRAVAEKMKGNKYGLGFTHKPETVAKIAAKNTGKRRTDEQKKRLGAASLKAWVNSDKETRLKNSFGKVDEQKRAKAQRAAVKGSASRAKASAASIESWKNEDVRKRRVDALRAAELRPDVKAKRKAANKGKKYSAERRAAMSAGMKGKQAGEKNGMYGKKHSAEALAKNSATQKALPVLACPYCEMRSRSVGNMKRYHFDNCKNKAA